MLSPSGVRRTNSQHVLGGGSDSGFSRIGFF